MPRIRVDENCLVAEEPVESDRGTEVDLLRPGIEIITDAAHETQFLSISWRMILVVKALRLLIQKEGVTVRRAARRRSRANVVGDEGCFGVQHRGVTNLHLRLDPVQDWAQDAERGERRVDIQADDQVGAGGGCAGEGKLGRSLGLCLYVSLDSNALCKRSHPSVGRTVPAARSHGFQRSGRGPWSYPPR